MDLGVNMPREITSRMVQMYNVPKGPGCDPCQIIIEDHGKRGGEVTVKCWTTSATYYWGSIGECSIKEFIVGLDFGYWSGKLFPGSDRSYFEQQKTEDKMKAMVIKYRREGELEKDEAREIYDYFDKEVDYSDSNIFCHQIAEHDFAEHASYQCDPSVLRQRLNHKRDRLRELFNPYEGDMDPVKSYDPHVAQIWYNSWLPFTKYLCENELKIPWKEPGKEYYQELREHYDRRPEDEK